MIRRTSQAEEPEKPRRAPPSPWPSPPFPVSEFQGYPLIGVPPGDETWPLTKAIYGCNTSFTDWLKDEKIRCCGSVTVSGNYSSDKHSNSPASWLVPNRLEMDQSVLRLARELDSVQTDSIDWAFAPACSMASTTAT